ncbi:MAG TPA: GAF domain-containing protein, partial [Candidatus Limnocylindria bacterium]|nr:GAF domain-containing protein [Candidatus Limnocylindria bacterium]
MTQADTLQSLADELRAELRAAYDSSEGALGSQPLQDAFSRFGSRATAAGISLENIMAGSVDVLQEFFEREGGYGADPSTMLAAGVSLAAAARGAGHSDPRSAAVESVPPLPPPIARLTALHRINRAATANLKLKEMLETTVGVVAETTGSDACAVFLYDDATGLLALRAAVGLNPTAVGAVTIRLGYGITGSAAETRELISAPDARKHPAFHAHPGIGDEIYQSQVSVPMLLQGQDRLVGVLNILTIARKEFEQDDLEFLRTVAGELAISIENARQYSSTDERLRRKLDELNKLQRISRIVTSTLNLSEVLRLITEQAVELIQAEAAAIYRRQHLPGGSDGEFQPIIEYRIGSKREVADPAQRDRLVSEVLRTGQPRNEEVPYVDGMCTLFCLPLRSARETLGTLCFRLRAGYELTEDSLGLLRTFSDSAALAIENAELYQDAMQSLNVQSTLVQEMHHRVRNNLQTVAALLSLQLRSAPDAPWETEIREAVSRIQAIATVHDLLSDETRLSGTTVDVIARHVAEDAYSTLIPPTLHVHFDIGESDLSVPSRQATILSLLINELISNAISHGFRDRTLGYIRFRAGRDGSRATIEVFNDGHHIPDGFDPAESSGLGMRIVQRL